MVAVDLSLITYAPYSALCPAVKVTIANEDGTSFDSSIFNYANGLLVIETSDIADVGTYNMQLIASFDDVSYNQVSTIPFSVILIEECARAQVTNLGQSSMMSPPNYYYRGETHFNVAPFISSLPECEVTYTCTERRYNLCNLETEVTSASFDSNSGVYRFSSTDNSQYQTDVITFTITGRAGAST